MTRRQFGTVRKLPSGRWQARYWHLGIRHEADRTFKTMGDAGAWLDAQRTDITRGTWVDPRAGRTTLAAYSREWLARRTDLEVRTRELYTGLLERHVLPILGTTTLTRLSPSQVRAWRAGLPTGESTAAKAYRLLAQIMRSAVTDELLVRSPCRVKGAGKEPGHQPNIVTVTELGRLEAALPERLRIVVPLAAWCQLRRGELFGLRRRHVDLLARVVHVAETRSWDASGAPLHKGPKSAAGVRQVAIPPHVVGPLERHLEAFVAPAPDSWVLTGELLGPIATKPFYDAWHAACLTTGQPHLRLHDLRHTGLTLAAAKGATIAELMYRAGHASPAAALRYQHATKDRDRVLADALSELVIAPVIEMGHVEGTEANP